MQNHHALQSALGLYQDALIRGLCHEGAIEIALGSLHASQHEAFLLQLPQLQNNAPEESKSPQHDRDRQTMERDCQ